jgi:hypothetical protein
VPPTYLAQSEVSGETAVVAPDRRSFAMPMRLCLAILVILAVAVNSGSTARADADLMSADEPSSGSSCPGPDSPCLTLTPNNGPVGTTVRISGRIHTDLKTWREAFRDPAYFALIHDYGHGFAGHAGLCVLLVGGDDGHARIARDGTVEGSLVVGATGSCFQESGTYPTQPGRYDLSIGCHACAVAVFDITSRLPFTGAATVGQVAVAELLLLLGVVLVVAGRRHIGAVS